jgi:hypothetical protein
MLLFLSILTLLSSTLSGCSGKAASGDGQDMAMASMDGMPAEVKSAPVTVQQAYQFAVANPDITKEFPCYCGCGKMGHTSNYSCYVQDVDSAGKITYDTHALGCSICVDITQDVMRLLKEKSQSRRSKRISMILIRSMALQILPELPPAGPGSQTTTNIGSSRFARQTVKVLPVRGRCLGIFR